MSKTLIIVASMNKNMELGLTIQTRIESLNHSTDLISLVPLSLPLFTPEYKEGHNLPSPMLDVVSRLKEAETFVIIAPEYNGGIPPILTNFLAWVSASTEDWRDCFNGKKAAIATHSGSGGLHLLMALRLQLSYLGVNVVGRQLHTNYGKPLKEESLDEVLLSLLN